LPSAGGFAERFFFRALDKKGFAESQIKNTQQSLCRVSNKNHLAKKFICRVPKKTLGKGFFAECQNKTLGTAIFQTTFWCSKGIQIKKFSTTKFHNFS
jgi:hypothetical protein